MKKVFTLLLVMCIGSLGFSQGGVVSNEDTTPAVIKKNFEIAVAPFGLFLGSYSGKFEAGILGDGLLGLAVKGNYTKMDNLAGTGTNISGYTVTGDLRIYPGRYIQGFYVYGDFGYTNIDISDSSSSANMNFETLLAGVGWKFAINEFAIDLGAGYGKNIYNGTAKDLPFPFNMALDFYLLFGYRF